MYIRAREYDRGEGVESIHYYNMNDEDFFFAIYPSYDRHSSNKEIEYYYIVFGFGSPKSSADCFRGDLGKFNYIDDAQKFCDNIIFAESFGAKIFDMNEELEKFKNNLRKK